MDIDFRVEAADPSGSSRIFDAISRCFSLPAAVCMPLLAQNRTRVARRTWSCRTRPGDVSRRDRRPHAADGRTRGLRARLAFGLIIYTQLREPAGALLDAGSLGADLRNLQDLSADAGQVPDDSRDLHRRRSSSSTSAFCSISTPLKVVIILLFSLIGIAGSYGVAWFGIRVNTFANSRTAFASLRGKPFPCYAIPLQAGMSIGMLLISVELLLMLCILLFIPGDYAGPCFIGFAIGESLGAAALRVAGGIFTKIADIGADLMKIVFKIKEDDARNPGVIADCTGDNAGDSVGPSADGFETYGVTGVALISFILLAVQRSAGAGAAAGLDLRHARHDGDRVRRSATSSTEPWPRRSTRNVDEDELRSAADHRWSG